MDYSTLNKEQYNAVMSVASKRLLLAGAGTGKTYSLIAAISRVIECGATPESVLVLTFTNAAALEMSERYKKHHPGERQPEFRTFHAFCYHLLATNIEVRKKLGYLTCPTVISKDEFKTYQSKARMISGCKLPESKLNRDDLSHKDALDQKAYGIALHKLLHKDNVITFSMMCKKVCKLFVDKEECIAKYLDRYKHIFVDEFQDTDPAQWGFVKSFVNSNILIVGDALQALYSFRGADSSIIKSIATDPEWETHILNENYRSGTNICEFANKMSTYADDDYRVPLQAVGNFDSTVSVRSVANVEYLTNINKLSKEKIVEWLDNCKGTTAILARTNKEVEELGDFLTDKGYKYSVKDNNKDNINILKSVQSSDYMCTWLSTMLTSEKYYTWAKLCSLEEDKPEEDRASPLTLLTTKFLNYKMGQLFNRICAIRNILRKDISRAEKAISIFTELNLPADLDVDTDVSTATEFLDNIINSLEEYKSEELYIGTIHSSKGLEYDNVTLLNVGTKLFPLDSEDMLNLYYVGITRAKNNLLVLKDIKYRR